MARMYRRHGRWDIFIHWFNAVCWLTLFFTGMGLMRAEYNVFGAWYPNALRALFGGGAGLLVFHEIVGFVWAAGFLLYLVFNFKGAAFFLREVFSVDPKRDIPWMLKKPLAMLLGSDKLAKLGMSPDIPDQGYYNMGQKGFGQLSVLSGIGLVITGLIMVLAQTTLSSEQTWLASWSILIHYVLAWVTFAGLLVHLYMAAVSPEERPGFKSMFSGLVPEDYAKHHHRLWWEKIKDEPEQV